MLSLSHGFLFVHVPKTAGNAIQDALRAWSSDAIVCLAPHQDGVERFELRSDRYRTQKHSTLAEYRREYGDAMLARLFKFACIRNPWDRCMSHDFSPHRGRVAWEREAFVQFVETSVRPLRHYLATEGAGQSLADAVGRLDAVIRHEHLQQDFAAVCGRLGLPPQRLAVRNSSTEPGHQRHWDEDLVALVRRRFGEEIELFGYAPATLAAVST